MQPEFGLLHFSTILPGAAFQRLARRIEAGAVQVIYDLEDTHWDPDDEERTRARRAAARLNLRALAAARSASASTPLTVRVNATASPDHAEDIKLLADLPHEVGPVCVVLPKVEDPDALARFLQRLRGESVTCVEVIPIVETQRAIDGLQALLTGLRAGPAAGQVQRIMYGMFDHCLDRQRWPFWDPRSREFWDVVSDVVAQIEACGFGYVHTPIAAIADDALFSGQIARLRSICTRRFDVTTLVEAQLQAARREARAPSPAPSILDLALREQELRARAAEIVQAYTLQRGRGRELGFVIAGRLGHFIAPHEYVAARAYLEAHPDDHP